MSIVKFKHTLSYYLKLFDTRKQNDDMFGALDAARCALRYAKTKIERDSINMLLGQAFFDMQLYTLSCEHYFRAIRCIGSRAGAYFGVGRNLVFLNKLDLSLEYFDKVLEWDFDGLFCEPVLEWVGVVKQKIKQNEKIDQSKKCVTLIEEMFRYNEFENAKVLVDDLLKKFPNDNQYLVLYAKCLRFLNDVDKSRQILKTVLKEEPQNTFAKLELMSICVFDEDKTSFLSLAKTIILADLNNNQILFLSKLYAGFGLYDDALSCLKILEKTKPYSPKVYLFLGICFHNMGKKEDALYNLAKARWIDYENSTLQEFYKIFNNSKTTLPLSEFLSNEAQNAKLQKLKTELQNENFLNFWLKNPVMEDETNWLLTTNNFDEGELLSFRLGVCKPKKIKNYCNNVLLSIRPNLKQKFFLTREILRNSQQHVFDLTSNFVYRSFSFKLKKRLGCIALFKNSITNAWAYIQCYAHNHKIKHNAEKLFEIILKNNLQSKIDEKTLTCLMFLDDYTELLKVCRYFQVDLGAIENAKYMLNLT